MRRASAVLAMLLMAIGIAMVAITASAGAGVAPAKGYLLGVLFVVAGAGRLWLARRGGM